MIAVVDTTTNSVAILSATAGYAGSILGPDGKIYMASHNATTFAEIDPHSNGTAVLRHYSEQLPE
ncbi:MAG: hypothetical protein JNM27_00230 [Leptospirales bacterium]|nr:hypothetical protein [Leptospirales bacterium]